MLSTLKPSLKVSLISLILIFSLTEVSRAHEHPSYSHRAGPKANNRGWMGALRNDLRLSDLTIPGTHESMSLHGTDYSKNQTMDLWSQLVSGVRVLDIRCAIVEIANPTEPPGAFFNLYHGSIYQKANFDEVLRTVLVFLRQNPGETVLMRVKQERTNDPPRFEDVFRRRYWNKDEYNKHFWKWTSENPTLSEMRGKIVVLQDFARWQCPERKPDVPVTVPHPDYGLCYNSFLDQDYFALDGNEDLYNKWEKVKKHLADANEDTPENNDKKYINYLSGGTNTRNPLAKGLPFPYFVVSGHWNPATGADRLSTMYDAHGHPGLYPNFPRLHSALFGFKFIYYEGTNTFVFGAIKKGGEYTRRVGIIMTDFPGGGLINRVICLNFPSDNLCWR